MTRRGWDSEDIIRSAFITPAGNCFLRTHKKRSNCFLESPIAPQVPVANHLKLVSPFWSLAMFISTTDPTTPCPCASSGKKSETPSKEICGTGRKNPAVRTWPQRLQPLSELLKLRTFAKWKRNGKKQKQKQISVSISGIWPPPSLQQRASKQIYFRWLWLQMMHFFIWLGRV